MEQKSDVSISIEKAKNTEIGEFKKEQKLDRRTSHPLNDGSGDFDENTDKIEVIDIDANMNNKNIDDRDMVSISGLDTTYKIKREGNGPEVKKGDSVMVNATGIIVESGKKFLSTEDSEQFPIWFKAGMGEVIQGWDQAVIGMLQGETRLIKIPGYEGYGKEGSESMGVLPNMTLFFEIEVLEIKSI